MQFQRESSGTAARISTSSSTSGWPFLPSAPPSHQTQPTRISLLADLLKSGLRNSDLSFSASPPLKRATPLLSSTSLRPTPPTLFSLPRTRACSLRAGKWTLLAAA
ncbi:hypothetical protein SLA2020_278620 [Shorea laevis]